MPKQEIDYAKIQRKKRLIGAIAVILLIIITVLAIAYALNFIVWAILDLIVAGIANLLLRRVSKEPL
jgi:hypothetical protein